MNLYLALSIGGIAVYLLIGLMTGLYVAREDKKRYGDNRYLEEDLYLCLAIGTPVLIRWMLEGLISTVEVLFNKAKGAVNFVSKKEA